jgi:hypothetical protein
MLITLKHLDIAFAMTPLREANSLSDLLIVTQLKAALASYKPTAQASIEISKERLLDLYRRLSSLQEGYSNQYAESIMSDSEGYTGLQNQIMKGAMAGNEEFIWLAEQVTAWRQNFITMAAQEIQSNLDFLHNLPIDAPA